MRRLTEVVFVLTDNYTEYGGNVLLPYETRSTTIYPYNACVYARGSGKPIHRVSTRSQTNPSLHRIIFGAPRLNGPITKSPRSLVRLFLTSSLNPELLEHNAV